MDEAHEGKDVDRALLEEMIGDVDAVVRRYTELLSASRNPLLCHDQDLLVDQARSVVLALAGRADPASSPDPSGEIGRARSAQGTHPRYSLAAASLLFDAALPVLAGTLAERGRPQADLERLAMALHQEIARRVERATVPYVDFLLQQLHESNFEERKRIARELHDQAAHSVGVGLQQLDLRSVDLERGDPGRAERRLEVMFEALQEAQETIRDLAVELGRCPTEHGLDVAVDRYLARNAPPTARVRLQTSGDLSAVPVEVRDELYYAVREAIRNALLHSGSDELSVTLCVRDGTFRGVVQDKGRGFDLTRPDRRAAGTGTGLASMRERAELLGGILTLTSDVGRGTCAELLVPL
jgi:signal transduction histidine kinase